MILIHVALYYYVNICLNNFPQNKCPYTMLLRFLEKIPNFLYMVQVGSQNIGRCFLKRLLSYSVCSQIWLNLPRMIANLATSQNG
jgi:hypothetical protein